MGIFIKVGYVTTRKGARLHLNINGRARCNAGSRRITSADNLTSASAPSICRNCAKHLRVRMIWRSDDLYRMSSLAATRELAEIDALFDEIDALRGPVARAASEAMKADLAATLNRMGAETPTEKLITDTTSENQISLF